MTTRTRKVEYAADDTLALDEFDRINVKVRITTLVDADVLFGLKQLAAKRRVRYQTLLNAALREYLKGCAQQPLTEARVRKIFRDELRKRA